MIARLLGHYATRIHLPASRFGRSLRSTSRRWRGKSVPHSQPTSLPQVSWTALPRLGTPRVWEASKANGNVTLAELAILSAAAASCPEGTSIFEIGTFDGRTTLNLTLNSAPGCPVFTLDLPPDHATLHAVAPGERHLIDKPTSGLRLERYQSRHPGIKARVHQLYGDSATYDYSPHWNTCSLVFVDGSHAYDYVVSDTLTALRLAGDGGLVFWHDYGVWEGVTRALEELDAARRLGLRQIRGTSLVCWEKPSPAPAD